LDNIADGLNKIVSRSGDSKGGGNNYNNSPLDQWAREFLGKNNEGFESNEYLKTGNELSAKASSIITEIASADEMDRKIAEKDFDKIIKRGIDALKGVISNKPLNPKPGSELEELIGSKVPEKQIPEIVRKFREDLRKLQIKTSNEDIWSDKDDPCAEEASSIVSQVTKKAYKPKEQEGFKELQRDVKKVVKNQPKIKELLLTPVKKVKI
jgi:hypothetical protein